MIRIGKSYAFEAAHFLPNHDGKCRNLHGHSYRVDVTLIGNTLHSDGPKAGMLMDFGDLDAQMKPIIDQLDHSLLNENEWLGVKHPTAEAIAYRIGAALINPHAYIYPAVDTVRVWETAKAWAEWKYEVNSRG